MIVERFRRGDRFVLHGAATEHPAKDGLERVGLHPALKGQMRRSGRPVSAFICWCSPGRPSLDGSTAAAVNRSRASVSGKKRGRIGTPRQRVSGNMECGGCKSWEVVKRRKRTKRRGKGLENHVSGLGLRPILPCRGFLIGLAQPLSRGMNADSP